MARRLSNTHGEDSHSRPGTLSPGPGRDLVTLYSHLVQTLESCCDKNCAGGRDALAARLSAMRQEAQPSPCPTPALSRMFRRLGITVPDSNNDAPFVSLAEQMGQAVTRPGDQVMGILSLFCAGDETLGLKAICGPTPLCHECGLTRECDYFNNPRVPAMAMLPPAARLLAGNDQALSDAELLAVLLYGDKATGREPVVSTMMTRYGRLRAIFRTELGEYASVRDMSKPQALRLAAVNALHRRLLAERRGEMLHIATAQDIHDRYAAELREYQTEAAVVLLLDQQHSVIRDAWFCNNSPTVNYVEIAELLRPAIREFAVRIALVHNHPSGNTTPSSADCDFTRRLRSACDIVGIGLVDHVIITETGYYSFADNNWLGV